SPTIRAMPEDRDGAWLSIARWASTTRTRSTYGVMLEAPEGTLTFTRYVPAPRLRVSRSKCVPAASDVASSVEQPEDSWRRASTGRSPSVRASRRRAGTVTLNQSVSPPPLARSLTQAPEPTVFAAAHESGASVT